MILFRSFINYGTIFETLSLKDSLSILSKNNPPGDQEILHVAQG